MNQNDSQKTRRNIIFSVSTVIFALCVAVVYIISNMPAISSFLSGIMTILTPVLAGAAVAYICNPILRFFENHPLRRIRSPYLKRTLSILFTYLFFILIVAMLGMLIVPQLIHSIKELFAKYDNYIANTVTYLNQIISSIMSHLPFDNSEGQWDHLLSLEQVNNFLNTLGGSLSGLFSGLLSNLTNYGSKLVSGITNIILALFISFYLLASKEKRVAQIKKLTAALFSEKKNKFIYETAALTNKAFGNFISGKIIDSCVVGLVEYIVFSIFNIPYAPMIACIMGITNVIPFFGPLIGAIPSAFIVFISDPSKLLLFIIITLIIQQIDGNIIEPKVLGDRTGVSSLCVIIAISVMGNLWGVFGMIIGVPLFAVVIALVQQYINAKLTAKGMSVDLNDYYRDEPEYVKALAQGKAKLSPRYYLDRFRYSLSSKARKHSPPPNKADYTIYPTAVEYINEEKPTNVDTASSENETEHVTHEEPVEEIRETLEIDPVDPKQDSNK